MPEENVKPLIYCMSIKEDLVPYGKDKEQYGSVFTKYIKGINIRTRQLVVGTDNSTDKKRLEASRTDVIKTYAEKLQEAYDSVLMPETDFERETFLSENIV
ncbi:MAG TPA: hypothetical protein PLC53_03935, partial [Bacilli bacterium]|nr:hypothetical protein [Bacilli bacterium]